MRLIEQVFNHLVFIFHYGPSYLFFSPDKAQWRSQNLKKISNFSHIFPTTFQLVKPTNKSINNNNFPISLVVSFASLMKIHTLLCLFLRERKIKSPLFTYAKSNLFLVIIHLKVLDYVYLFILRFDYSHDLSSKSTVYKTTEFSFFSG